jgi:hypothetical protein
MVYYNTVRTKTNKWEYTIMKNKELIERAAYLLGVVEQFIKENRLEDYMTVYDEAECDGACLADDCKDVREMFEMYLNGETKI